MYGKLYLCATPIGNLEDITLRVLKTLNEVDLIAAEDTRQSIKLLNHYKIKTPMTSYHEHNKNTKTFDLIRQLKEGKNIALISDAGLPGISDPGEELVRECHDEGILVTTLPGASAGVTALSVSGISTKRFCFEGFLPVEKKQRKRILESLTNETRTIILYEAPHHLVKTLEDILMFLGDRKVVLCRELTKKFETIEVTKIETAIPRLIHAPPRGEYVVIIEGKAFEEIESDKIREWEKLSIKEHLGYYIEKKIDKKQAMKLVAKDRGISKRDVYQVNILENQGGTKNERN